MIAGDHCWTSLDRSRCELRVPTRQQSCYVWWKAELRRTTRQDIYIYQSAHRCWYFSPWTPGAPPVTEYGFRCHHIQYIQYPPKRDGLRIYAERACVSDRTLCPMVCHRWFVGRVPGVHVRVSFWRRKTPLPMPTLALNGVVVPLNSYSWLLTIRTLQGTVSTVPGPNNDYTSRHRPGTYIYPYRQQRRHASCGTPAVP